MNIDDLTTYLTYRKQAIELITWLRDNYLLADNTGDKETDIRLAEEYAFGLKPDRALLAKIKHLLDSEHSFIALAIKRGASWDEAHAAWENQISELGID